MRDVLMWGSIIMAVLMTEVEGTGLGLAIRSIHKCVGVLQVDPKAQRQQRRNKDRVLNSLDSLEFLGTSFFSFSTSFDVQILDKLPESSEEFLRHSFIMSQRKGIPEFRRNT